MTIQLKEINQKATGERRNIKKVWRQEKTIQTKREIPKQRKKILPTRGDVTKTYQPPDARETKQF